MRTRQIAVIDPAMNRAETDCFNSIVAASALPVCYHLPKLGGMDSLHHQRGKLAGIIVLGSSSSVNDSFEWQKEMNAWLLPQMQSGIPTLGLCYGHQLIAYLFGAKVDFIFPDKEKHLGFRKVTLSPNRLWDNQKLEGKLVVSHREHVVTVPDGFEVVATSPETKIDGLAHQRLPIWSFQSHPESTLPFLRSQKIPAGEPLTFGENLITRFLKFCEKN